jgi:hypothetical protein
MTAGDRSWPPELDGVIAAPDWHRVLLETPAGLEVVIEPGSRSPSTPTATAA